MFIYVLKYKVFRFSSLWGFNISWPSGVFSPMMLDIPSCKWKSHGSPLVCFSFTLTLPPLLSPYSRCQSQVVQVTHNFYLIWLQTEIPIAPSSGLINLLKQLSELRKTVYLLVYQFTTKTIKGYEWTTWWRNIRGKVQKFLFLWNLGCATPLACACILIHQPRSSLDLVLLGS